MSTNPVVTRVIGGLGNQMFQYAAGKALAERLGCELLIDRTALDGYKLRSYLLDEFSISAEEVPSSKLKDLGFHSFSSIPLIGNKVDRFYKNISSKYYQERSFSYDPGLKLLQDPRYIQGYWQSQDYFADIEDIIRRDFSFQKSGEMILEIKEKIANCCSVSLHVRRGDYISNSKTFSMHGICSMEYYQRCIEFFLDKNPDSVFFVFSDDVEWVSENFGDDKKIVIVGEVFEANALEDLELMSLCRHHIIANSTFSWWGAWLNSRSDKVVVAPKVWFQSPSVSTDLIPSSWLVF